MFSFFLFSGSSVPTLDFSSIKVPGASTSTDTLNSATAAQRLQNPRSMDDPEMIRNMFMANPDQLALLKQNNPRLADALLTGNLGKEINIEFSK